MTRRIAIAALLMAAGCGTDPNASTPLDVQMLSVSGDLRGEPLAMSGDATESGNRDGDVGTFFVESPSLSLQLSACPLGDGAQNTDPYGVGIGGGDPSGAPIPFVDDAGVGERGTGTIGGVECRRSGLFVCGYDGCGSFEPSEVTLDISEEGGWRHVVADADGANGTVRVELRYRETH